MPRSSTASCDPPVGCHASCWRRPGPIRPAVVTVEFLREVYVVLRGMVDFVIVDTPPGFTPEVIAAIDSVDRGVHGRDARRPLAEEHQAGPRDARADGIPTRPVTLVLNRADTSVGITDDDVLGDRRARADILVPSDRDIPRSVNEGAPIVACEAAVRRRPRRSGRSPSALSRPTRDGGQTPASRRGVCAAASAGA